MLEYRITFLKDGCWQHFSVADDLRHAEQKILLYRKLYPTAEFRIEFRPIAEWEQLN